MLERISQKAMRTVSVLVPLGGIRVIRLKINQSGPNVKSTVHLWIVSVSQRNTSAGPSGTKRMDAEFFWFGKWLKELRSELVLSRLKIKGLRFTTDYIYINTEGFMFRVKFSEESVETLKKYIEKHNG